MKVSPKKTSLGGLRIFCVAAKYCNHRLAAEELSVTASAVSHQVKSLEEELGIELCARDSRSLRLTDHGERLYLEIEPVIADIDEKIAAFVSSVVSRCVEWVLETFQERGRHRVPDRSAPVRQGRCCRRVCSIRRRPRH